MAQSSPEGIILGKGSKLVSMELSINKEKVLNVKKEKTYTEKNMDDAYDKGFKDGINKQLDKMYNNDEVLKLLLNIKRVNIYYEDVEKWFQQFKKK